MDEIITLILPIIAVASIWYFLFTKMKKISQSNPLIEKQDEMISLLKEIKDELKELNKNNSEKK